MMMMVMLMVAPVIMMNIAVFQIEFGKSSIEFKCSVGMLETEKLVSGDVVVLIVLAYFIRE